MKFVDLVFHEHINAQGCPSIQQALGEEPQHTVADLPDRQLLRLRCLDEIIWDDEIGSQLCEQEEGATTVACVASQTTPDEEIEEVHRQTR